MRIEDFLQDQIAKRSEESALEGVAAVGPQKAMIMAAVLSLQTSQKFFTHVKEAADKGGRFELTPAIVHDFNAAVMANGLLQDVTKIVVSVSEGGSVGVEPGTVFN